ncbi:polymorphic outer membrane protein middle domain-containing protein [Chlamydia vaughanii]|uniref:polymorphic outer membrane protein middle domain-containing protein n=1 Tax=Chlamydia vaughanii TaxID=3112552 RepID=UPI0032B2EFBA
MYPYACSFILLTSLVTCSYQVACFSEQQSALQFHSISENQETRVLCNFLGTERLGQVNKGLLHNANVNLDITGNKHFCLTGQYFMSNGGAITAKDLKIIKNSGPVIFQKNKSTGHGGAISSSSCLITENQKLCCFINNCSSLKLFQNNPQHGGAINCSGDLDILNNKGSCQFLNNTATSFGGAFKTENNVHISNNFGDIIFSNNKCLQPESKGGAVYARYFTISGNQAPVTFMDNQSGAGGALFILQTCAIVDNPAIIKFLSNNSVFSGTIDSSSGWEPGGGAVSAHICQIQGNPNGVIFSNNSAKYRAGAIFGNTILINDNGPVTFVNNSSSNLGGGGIFTRGDNPKIHLFADNGNIVFDGNLNIKNLASHRNALATSANASLKLGAREGQRIAFYDPIEHETTTPTPALFNPESHHLGTVLFSGAHVPSYSGSEKDYCSYIRNTANIVNGVVAVEDKACLAVYNLTQNEGFLRLGDQASIITTGKPATNPSTAGCTITLTKLALNLPSLLKKGAQAPKIWIYPKATTTTGTTSSTTYAEDTEPTITISGPLTLLDNENQNPYDSLDISGGITKVPFLYLCDNQTKKINIDDLNIEAINDVKHYGYQGIWSPHWEEYTTTADSSSPLTANTSHRVLYADWTPTHYIPDPQYRNDLVSNALWQAAYTMMTGMHTLENSPKENTRRELSGGALGAYVTQKTRKGIPGFDLFSKGYSVKTRGSSETKHQFSLSFAQFYSQMKELKTKNTISSNCYFAGAQLQIPWFDDVITSASAGYAYSYNQLKTHDKNNREASKGDFYGHTLGAEISCMLPEESFAHFLCRPFIKASALRATQESFTETGSNIRNFKTKTPLTNVTLPLGLYFHRENKAHLKTSWEFQFAYIPTIYREKPEVITSRIISKGMWITSGTHVDHHAGSISAKNTTTLSNMSLGIHYRGDFSKSTLCNFLNVIGEIQF